MTPIPGTMLVWQKCGHEVNFNQEGQPVECSSCAKEVCTFCDKAGHWRPDCPRIALIECGRQLREMRTEAGRTMGDMAKHLHCSLVRVSDIERGIVEPTSAELRAFRAYCEARP